MWAAVTSFLQVIKKLLDRIVKFLMRSLQRIEVTLAPETYHSAVLNSGTVHTSSAVGRQLRCL